MYNKLLTKKIDLDKINNTINLKDITNIMEECYRNIAFSTFGYIFRNTTSRISINQYNSANCIGMSMWVQQELQKKNIKSYLIPASIPKIYQMREYLDISHVALFVPQQKNSYIIDCSFYFLSPIIIDLKKNDCISNIFSKKIYDNELSNDILTYKSISVINCSLKKTETNLILNDFQTIPQNTFYCDCNYKNDRNDKWRYYIINITNPDEAITTFFIKIKKNPFICTHEIDNNGIPICKYYIKFNNSNISIKKEGITELYTPTEFIDLIQRDKALRKRLEYYFKDNFNSFIIDFYKLDPITANLSAIELP